MASRNEKAFKIMRGGRRFTTPGKPATIGRKGRPLSYQTEEKKGEKRGLSFVKKKKKNLLICSEGGKKRKRKNILNNTKRKGGGLAFREGEKGKTGAHRGSTFVFATLTRRKEGGRGREAA